MLGSSRVHEFVSNVSGDFDDSMGMLILFIAYGRLLSLLESH